MHMCVCAHASMCGSKANRPENIMPNRPQVIELYRVCRKAVQLPPPVQHTVRVTLFVLIVPRALLVFDDDNNNNDVGSRGESMHSALAHFSCAPR